MSRNLQNFDLTAGETRTLTLTARDATGAILNLSGATIQWDMARTARSGSVLTKTGAIVSAALGTFTVALAAGDTTSFSGDYWHQAKVTKAGVVTMAVQGQIRIENLIGQATVDWNIWP